MKNIKNEVVMIGIDVSKNKLDIYDSQRNEYLSLANTQKAIKEFIQQLKKTTQEYFVVMENTGGYEKLAHRLFYAAGIAVHIAHAARVHHFAKQKGIFAKTDKIDAKTLARFASQESLSITEPLTKEVQALKELTTRRAQIVEQITQEKYRLGHDVSTQLKRSLKRNISHLEREKSRLEEMINKLVEALPEKKLVAKRLQTFKGIGQVTANSLVSLLPELGHLSREEIACLVGVAPKNADSGKKTRRRVISGGRFHVRKLLYMAALVSMRHNKTLKAYYEKLRGAGKSTKVALVALMRKIIITLNSMIKNEKDWEEDYRIPLEARPVFHKSTGQEPLMSA